MSIAILNFSLNFLIGVFFFFSQSHALGHFANSIFYYPIQGEPFILSGFKNFESSKS